MITAALQLAAYGISVADARTWVVAHLQDPAQILKAAGEYGITNGMLAEIAGSAITAQQVSDFFASQGIDSKDLDVKENRVELITASLPALHDILSMNNNTGLLDTQALRAEAQSLTGKLDYWELFSPNRIAGAFDGVLTPQELGTSALGTIAATPENIESLFYGTMIKLLSNIDAQELADIQSFALKSAEELQLGDKTAIADYSLLFAQAMQDAPEKPLAEATVRDVLVDAVAIAVELVGSGNVGFELLLLDSYPLV